MGVIRNKLKNKYLTLPNEIIEDIRISSGAFRVFCYISSKDDGWKVRNKDIQKRLNIKQAQTLANYYKKLCESGWIKRIRAVDHTGNFVGGFDYHIMEKPYYGKTLISEKPQLLKNHIHSKPELFSNTENNSNIEGYIFDEFWFDYDKKVGPRDRIKKKFEKLSEKDRNLIKDYLPKYKKEQPEKKFRKNPETFLNQKSWNDEIILNEMLTKQKESNYESNHNANKSRPWNQAS
jgi:hypothetical protein